MSLDADPRVLLNKLAFGPTNGELQTIQRGGAEAWLLRQLTPEPDDDCAPRIAGAQVRVKYESKNPDAKVDEDRPIGVIAQPIEQHWQVVEKGAPFQERAFFRSAVAHATLIRAVHSRWQVREVLSDFWHNHFNVNALGESSVAVSLPAYDRDVIRRHALGNFRAMLEAVATSAAMQIYLNNRSSRGGAANENYARELFELHTLGRPAYLNALYNKWRKVPGALDGRPQGYIDQDVYEAARAFTGWTIEDGTGLGPGRKLPTTGKFIYLEMWHDNYQKRILATEFEPYQKPMSDGLKVLDLVADHPATARYVCGKLCRRLMSDAPDAAALSAAITAWTDNRRKPDQIARTVEAIVRSDAFRRSGGAKIKRPLELYASFARAVDIDASPTTALLGALAGSGQRLFGWGPPTGHPDDSDYWLSSSMMRMRWTLLLGLADDAWKTGAPRRAQMVAEKSTPEQAVDTAHRLLLDREAPPGVHRAIAAGLDLAPGSPFNARKDALPLARRMLAYCAMTPAFQMR